MSNDYVHFVVQLPNGKWKVAKNQDFRSWQEAANIDDYKRAKRIVRPAKHPTFNTWDEANDYLIDSYYEYTTFGDIVIQYEDYYGS